MVLFPETQGFDNSAIALDILVANVIQQIATLSDELQKPAPARKVFGVLLQVGRQLVDPLGEERDLDFRRSGVAFVQGVGLDNLCLTFFGYGHVPPFLSGPPSAQRAAGVAAGRAEGNFNWGFWFLVSGF
jgi:hypothetical protein